MHDDGVLYVCNLINQAENGDMPQMKLAIQNKYWFENRTVGYGRFYTAQGVNQRVDRLVRISWDVSVEIGQYAVLGNGEQFVITMVSHGQESFQRTKMIDSKFYRQPQITGLKFTELTLTRVEKNYDVATEEDQGQPSSY